MVWLDKGYRAYLDPKEPTFLGLLNMVYLYKVLKKVGYLGFRVEGFGQRRMP